MKNKEKDTKKKQEKISKTEKTKLARRRPTWDPETGTAKYPYPIANTELKRSAFSSEDEER